MNKVVLKEKFILLKNQIDSSISLVSTHKNSHLQNYLYLCYYPLFSFTESIIILCENNKNKSAQVLLRSLYEAHINIVYHQLGDSERKLAISSKNALDQRLKIIREIKDLIKKYPNLKSEDPAHLYNEYYLASVEEKVKNEREAILKGSKITEKDMDPELKLKAIDCDNLYAKNVEKGHFENTYSLVYRQLSPIAHLNVEGLQGFINLKDGQHSFSEIDDGDFFVSQAVGVCVQFVKDIYEKGLIEGEAPDTISQIENLIKNIEKTKLET